MLPASVGYSVDWQTARDLGFAWYGDGAGTPTPDAQAAATTTPDPRTGFQNLVERQGGVDAAAFLLYQENHGYRDRLRQTEQQLRDLQGRLPGEGAVVLAPEQAQAWQSYQALGQPDEVQQRIADYSRLQREAHFRDVAEAHSFNPVVLAGLPGAADLTIEIGEETLNGKTSRVAYVVQADGKKIALPDYAAQTWGPFLPALQAGGAAAATPSGTRFVHQQTGSGKAPSGKVEEWREKQRKAQEGKKNPLMG